MAWLQPSSATQNRISAFGQDSGSSDSSYRAGQPDDRSTASGHTAESSLGNNVMEGRVNTPPPASGRVSGSSLRNTNDEELSSQSSEPDVDQIIVDANNALSLSSSSQFEDFEMVEHEPFRSQSQILTPDQQTARLLFECEREKNSLKQKIERLQSDLDQSKKASEDATRELLSQFEQSLAQKDQEISALRSKNSSLDDQTKQIQQKFHQLSVDNQDLIEKIRDLEKEKTTLQSENSQLHQKAAEMQVDFDDITLINHKLEGQKKSLQSQIDQLLQKTAELQVDVDDITVSKKALEHEKAVLEKQKSVESLSLSSMNDEQSATIKQLIDQIEELQHQNKNLSDEVKGIREAVDSQVCEILQEEFNRMFENNLQHKDERNEELTENEEPVEVVDEETGSLRELWDQLGSSAKNFVTRLFKEGLNKYGSGIKKLKSLSQSEN